MQNFVKKTLSNFSKIFAQINLFQTDIRVFCLFLLEKYSLTKPKTFKRVIKKKMEGMEHLVGEERNLIPLQENSKSILCPSRQTLVPFYLRNILTHQLIIPYNMASPQAVLSFIPLDFTDMIGL